MTPDHLALLADTRLPDGARILAMYIDLVEKEDDGFAEIPHDEFRRLLYGGPSDDTIRRHLRQLDTNGWVESRPGGRGHANRYKLLAKDECGSNGVFRTALVQSLKNRVGHAAGLKSLRVGTGAKSKLRDDVVVGTTEEEDEEVAGAREALPGDVENLIRSERLEGCRGPLRDYLVARVPSEVRQLGYVQSIYTWLDGAGDSHFMLPNGSKVPPEERSRWIGAALNDLLGSDEQMMSRPVGDVANLRTKIRILVADEHRPRKPPSPDFGDETERDLERASRARKRQSRRQMEEQEDRERDADREMAELWSWWEDQDAETRARIKSEAESKANGMPEPLHRSVLIGVIQEHRTSGPEQARSA